MEIRYSTASEKLDAVQKYVVHVKEWLIEDCIDKGSYDQIEKLNKALKLIHILGDDVDIFKSGIEEW